MKNVNIIKKNHEFQKIISMKTYKNSKSFVVYYRNKDDGFLKYGISVGKKIGNAVLRNYIKRVVRTIVFSLLEKYKQKKLDIIVIVKNKFLGLDYNENYKQLDNILLSL
ncbi:ribonuclease P protein component [Spiroplasma turonicum]|uniref:ribonuclease P protein component n=1 Tax=Spiroplasma turonicum TaxID=216946 RepID=UPI000742D78F|nr:ribonuclease P protein component [Spiroplasma turonicum]ALX71334.1 ribonuclease P (protein C5) [Spiroplasma turonicum]